MNLSNSKLRYVHEIWKKRSNNLKRPLAALLGLSINWTNKEHKNTCINIDFLTSINSFLYALF